VPDVERPTASGRHEFWYEGELFGVRFRGSITRRDVEVLRQAVEAVAEEHPRSYLLIDLHGSTGIDPEARKYLVEWSKVPEQGLVGTVVYGTGFVMRSLVTLSINAIRLLGHLKGEFHFFKDEAEARRWADGHRARTGGAQRDA
jgi:hypothetical protein